MKKHEDIKNPLTGMLMRKLNYSFEDFKAVKEFISEYYKKDYKLSFVDESTGSFIELDNNISELLEEIPFIVSMVSSMEHTFAYWVGINNSSKSYMVSIDFTRGNLETGNMYHYNFSTKSFEKRM